MKLNRLLTACLLVVVSGVGGAQTGTRAADPITGTWTGDMGPDATTRMRINLDLKFDGKAVSGVITGPGLTPGDINGGTFEANSGAITFLVVVRDGDTRVQFEGARTADTISGRVSSATVSGTFRVVRGAPMAQPPTASPVRPLTAGDSALIAVRAGFTQVNDWLTRSMALVPVDKYSYRPVASVRTFGQLVAHVVDSYHYYCGRAVSGRSAQWSDAVEKGATDRATLTQKLRLAIDVCNGAYESGQLGPLMENVAHTNLHYGNMVTYMRMLGLTPPSS